MRALSDLSEYDKAIVEAAEAWDDETEPAAMEHRFRELVEAVRAKREARRPQCTVYKYTATGTVDVCGKVAVQVTNDSAWGELFRCLQHRVTVIDL